MIANAATVVLLYMVEEGELVAMSARLTGYGFQVVPVGSLDECRRALAEHQIECAFVEVRTTHPVGLSAIHNIKSAHPDAPVAVLSSNKDLSSRIAGRDAGAEHYLATPIRNIDLEMRIAEIRKGLERTPASRPAVAGAELASPSEAGEAVLGLPDALDDSAARGEGDPKAEGPSEVPSPLAAPKARALVQELPARIALPEPTVTQLDTDSEALPLPEPDTLLAEENESLRSHVSQLRAKLADERRRAEEAELLAAEAIERMNLHDQHAQLALSQARSLVDAARGSAREAPSIAGGHTPDIDPLTGLIGPGALQDHLDREYARARRYGHALSVLMLDVDKLASYDKSYGEEAGDRALCLVADVLRSALRSPDIAARLGGDDFVILATDTSEEQAFLLAERLRQALRSEAQHTTQPPVTLSIGIASSRRLDVKRAEDLLVSAQAAVMRAKSAGRNRSVIASS